MCWKPLLNIVWKSCLHWETATCFCKNLFQREFELRKLLPELFESYQHYLSFFWREETLKGSKLEKT